MHTRRHFLLTLGTGLLTAKTLWAAPDASPSGSADAADVVRQYLAFHATDEWVKAYALLSPDTQKLLPYAQFIETKQIPSSYTADGLTPSLSAISLMIVDAGNTMGAKFQVIGVAPEDPHIVLVSARLQPLAPTDDLKPLLLRIATIPGPKANGALYIDMMASFQSTDPVQFSLMREQARQTASLSNLKQIGLAMFQYVNDHDETYPPADIWVDALTPYLAGSGTAPAEKARIVASLFRDQSAPAGQKWCYAFNSNLSGIKLADVNSVAATVLLFETTTGLKNAADAGESVPSPGWHTKGVDVCFADGHARWLADKAPRPSFVP